MDDLNKMVNPYDFDKLSPANFARHYGHLCKFLESLALKKEFDMACSLAYIEAEHYKHLAQIDGIRDEAKECSRDLLLKSEEYGEKA